jgi:hypothetical protein
MIDEGVLHELSVVADFLVKHDPDATWCDLLKYYLAYRGNADYSSILAEPPDDEEIIKFHTHGGTPKEIAGALGDDPNYITWVLLQYGFSPFVGNRDSRNKLSIECARYEELKRDGRF